VHDSGFERAHVADVAAEVGVPFAPLTRQTTWRLAAVLDPGLEPGNPLDVWGTGRDSAEVFTESLSALADDPGVAAVALAVDLVPEYDGDDSYRDAVLAAAAKTGKPVAVLASVPAAIDEAAASRLRAAGVPVLESTRTGLLALRHLLGAPWFSRGAGGESRGSSESRDRIDQHEARRDRFARLLAGVRGKPPCDIDAVISAIAAFSVLVADLGDNLDGFDINPLICSPSGVLAVDALAVPSAASRPLLA
jgi:acyl-CoA synthetase (NDP forming)